MAKKKESVFQIDEEVVRELRAAQWTYGKGNDDVFELRLELASPAAVTAEKASAPAVGLPTLDGFLSYIAFRVAVSEVLKVNPSLAQRVLWQWNTSLRKPTAWIDFKLPIQQHVLRGHTLYDCSVGLPIVNDDILYPAGSLFTADGKAYEQYPKVVDSIPLRRRVAEPYGRQIELKSNLVSGSGKTKALDNRLHFPLTQGYSFLFRGDAAGVEKLISFAIENNVGIGKKTSLGFGRISSFSVSRSDLGETWCRSPVLTDDRKALIKSLPFDLVFAEKDSGSKTLEKFLGCNQFSLQALIETFGTYRPPYWLRERRTQIIRYGSIIQERR